VGLVERRVIDLGAPAEGETGAAGALLPGALVLATAAAAAALAFQDGFAALARAWATPEYSHGPLIPAISAFLLLRQMRDVPPAEVAAAARRPGALVMLFALALGLIGTASGIGDIVAYAIIVWVFGVVLAGFGLRRGWILWPAVLHLVFMLPLPDLVYYRATIWLQFAASELGVAIIRAAGVPALLEGNVIRLDGYALHVAEACSGLRYLFPALSFTYIFAVLHRGPLWHKAALLAAAVPITVAMNAARIGAIGIMVDRAGVGHAEGFMHAFEGWAVFLLVIALTVGLSAALQRLGGDRRGALAALDLDTAGLKAQARRIGDVRPWPALVAPSAALALAGALALAAPALGLAAAPEPIRREPFALFPRELGPWRTVSDEILAPAVAAELAADDYLSRRLRAPGRGAEVDLFIAWHRHQARGGVHSPEICIPGSGWEIAALAAIDAPAATPGGGALTIRLNRAVIQKGAHRQMVYYWFDQRGRRLASDYLAKAYLVLDAIRTGRSDGALVRLITPIRPDETEAAAEARLRDVLAAAMPALPGFIATDWPAEPQE
jgi:exosortase D (VPLPA-CTERM-specific)